MEEELQARECLFPTSPANHRTLDKSLTGVARLVKIGNFGSDLFI